MLLSIITILILCVMVYSDLKHRQVPLVAYILLCGVFVAAMVDKQGQLEYFFLQTLINVLIVVLLLASVQIWFLLKNKSYKPIIDVYLGKGDILLWILLCMYFTPLVFITFQTISMMISLLLYGLFLLLAKGKSQRTIPLAGIQSIFIIAIEGFKLIGFNSFQYRDDLVLKFLC